MGESLPRTRRGDAKNGLYLGMICALRGRLRFGGSNELAPVKFQHDLTGDLTRIIHEIV